MEQSCWHICACTCSLRMHQDLSWRSGQAPQCLCERCCPRHAFHCTLPLHVSAFTHLAGDFFQRTDHIQADACAPQMLMRAHLGAAAPASSHRGAAKKGPTPCEISGARSWGPPRGVSEPGITTDCSIPFLQSTCARTHAHARARTRTHTHTHTHTHTVHHVLWDGTSQMTPSRPHPCTLESE